MYPDFKSRDGSLVKVKGLQVTAEDLTLFQGFKRVPGIRGNPWTLVALRKTEHYHACSRQRRLQFARIEYF